MVGATAGAQGDATDREVYLRKKVVVSDLAARRAGGETPALWFDPSEASYSGNW
jgi:hypothetical protein